MPTTVENYVVAGGAATPMAIVNQSLPRLSAGEAMLGKTGVQVVQIDCSPVLTVHANYATGDYVGTSGVPIVIPEAARVNGGSGRFKSIMIIDKANAKVAGELWFFDDTITPPADSAAWSITDADAMKCIGVVAIGASYYASALNAVAQDHTNNIGFKCALTSRNIYACFVTRGAPTYADGDLVFRFNIIQD